MLDEIKADKDIRGLIITGAGRSFVAGADIAAMSVMNEEEGFNFGVYGNGVFRKIELLDIPVIAAVNGFALGGGCELAMACDIRIAAETAIFGQPEVGLGIIPGFGGTIRMAKLVGKGMAKYLIMSNDKIDGKEAHRIGLVEKVVPLEELMAEAEKVARMVMAQGPIAIAQAKKAIDAEFDIDMMSAGTIEVQASGVCFATDDQTEGMTAFLEKRPAEFKNK